MGIGNTMKSMFQDDTLNNATNVARDEAGNIVSSVTNAAERYEGDITNEANRISSYVGRSQKLPPGTGPGTSGKPDSEKIMEHDLERSKEQGCSGHGTDAAAALGGSLGDTHKSHTTGAKARASATSRQPSGQKTKSAKASQIHTADAGDNRDAHVGGNSRVNAKNVMPTGKAEEDTNQLNPVTHETIRHIETEEVERVKDLERHVHHVQHHIQLVTASEELMEQIREQVYPVTQVYETHVNKSEDSELFEGQVNQQHDTLQHKSKERSIVDKGTVVNEHVHHHIHHVIQPIIEKETVDRQRIHTTIPIREVTHEAPIVHQSQTHAAVPLEHFLQHGGTLSGALTQDSIGNRVLQSGHCTREVDGVAEDLSRELGLSDQSPSKVPSTSKSASTTKTAGSPNLTTHTHAPSHAIREGVDMRTAHRPVNIAAVKSESTGQALSVPTA